MGNVIDFYQILEMVTDFNVILFAEVSQRCGPAHCSRCEMWFLSKFIFFLSYSSLLFL